MDFKVSGVAGRLAREKGVDLPPVGLGEQVFQGGAALALGCGVALLLPQLDEGDGVFEVAVELGERAKAIFKLVALAHDLLRGLRVGPQGGVLDAGVQFREAAGRGIDVKDASSAIPRTA